MKNLHSLALGTITMCLFCSCATIFSKIAYDVRINSTPRNASVTVYNRKGLEVFSGTTPCHAMLKPGAGYFKKAIYELEFTKEGYADKKITLQADINGWYFGNLLIGGLVGMLIVDPATGAMYKLNNTDIDVALPALNSSINKRGAETGLTIMLYTLEDVPSALKSKLVTIR